MLTKLATVTVVVKNQDEALDYYTKTLGLKKRMDMTGEDMRWLTVAVNDTAETEIVLQDQKDAKGLMPGGSTMWGFFCDDCRKTFDLFKSNGVKFTQEPVTRPYGVEAMFEDLYGNSFFLLEPNEVAIGRQKGDKMRAGA